MRRALPWIRADKEAGNGRAQAHEVSIKRSYTYETEEVFTRGDICLLALERATRKYKSNRVNTHVKKAHFSFILGTTHRGTFEYGSRRN